MIHREHTTYTAPTALPVNLADALNSRRALWDYAGMVGGARGGGA